MVGRTKFSIDLLFSEPVNCTYQEVVDAVNHDYAWAAVKVSDLNPNPTLDTATPVLGILDPVHAENGDRVLLIAAGYPDEKHRNADHTELLWRSGAFWDGASQAIKTHKSYLNISISAVDDTLAARFRAARQLTVVAAAFAKLPMTLAVHVLWAQRMSSPQDWMKAADQAAKGDWPLFDWISYRSGWDQSRWQGTDYAVGFTTGLSQFTDYEIHMEAAPILPTDVIKVLYGACYLPLQGGNVYRDGDTMGGDDGGPKYRIRARKGGEQVMVLLHPGSPVDEMAVFGKSSSRPPPFGMNNEQRPKKGFMRRLLGRN